MLFWKAKGRPRAGLGQTIDKVEKRKADFYNSLIPYLQQYPKEMIRAFFDYWSELNKSRTKMRFENEKTWETPKRLMTWASKEKDYGTNRRSNTQAALEAGATAINRMLANIDGEG